MVIVHIQYSSVEEREYGHLTQRKSGFHLCSALDSCFQNGGFFLKETPAGA